MTNTGALLARGLAHHQAGRLAQADAAYRKVLTRDPREPDALHLLGVLTLQQGKLAEGTRFVQQAVSANPTQPAFWNSLGAAEQAAGQLDDAAGAFQRAADLSPTYAEAWANLAATHEARGDQPAEATALARLTALMPTHARAWGRRGVLAFLSGQVADAATALRQAVTLAPDDADVWCNLGAVLIHLEQYSEAEAGLRRAVTLRPDSVDALGNLGAVLVALARWADAGPVLERALTLDPGRPNVWLNLGHTRKGLEQFAEAVAAYERALALVPDFPAALIGLGDALQGLGDPPAAIVCYERALAGSPRDPDAYEHLEIALQQLGRPDPASSEPSSVAADLQRLVGALRQIVADRPDCPQTHSYFIVALDVTEGAEAEAQAARHLWNARFGGAARGGRPSHATHSNNRNPGRPLRVGYVSADFRHHSATFLILPILRAHDRTQVSVVCYSGVTVPDPITEECRALADLWRETARLSDDELAALIRQDEIDILVDLSGHTRANRLTVFAREPAPVQVTAWGYATGTGLDSMHYFLADPIVVPPEAHELYSESVVNLPSVVCYEPPAFSPPVAPLPALTRGYVTFGAFNRLTKITAESVAAWGSVLMAVPDARLIVKSAGLDGDTDRERLLGQLAACGVARERVTLLGATPQGEHLAAHAEIDIMLDTFPHCGGITTLDALLMGVPVVTLLGERVAGRLSASFLTMLELGELVAQTQDAYVEIAARLTHDVDRLARERETLRDRLMASPMADAAAYTQAVEAAYREMWTGWCERDLTPIGSDS